ncbi:SDR family NAD(P)-dependent oxidoreductase [Rhizobium halophytocola]|uniref:NAD(P)-dependent dehydrogenase (Short-subunit alcohol dehydrogenase family) n=1 Tax=Rhizobium halophytocola TaxID=735519 RepID=A0ABS4E2Y0_9HYPH|nr:SDR family NAD(P)-dependent oxidoreductase [Rhizobium halophytocola]MBP1852294.1 NAD(P)-dependent dehydrogenase (short-subunit alcohol dehydrogenase family) [Rhizobium halophytocola]
MKTYDHVIITGGSSGIGLALAGAYLERGAKVTLIARSLERLDRAVVTLSAISGDCAERLFAAVAHVEDSAEMRNAVASAVARFGECNLLINSAGLVIPSAFDQMGEEAFAEQIEVNLVGTANAIRCVLQPMKARGAGTILVISSGAALIGIDGYSAYCASKAGLVGFAEALRTEIEPFGIDLAICYPPDTDTPQLAAELPLRSAAAARVMGTVAPWPVEAVAGRIVAGLDRRRREIHFGASLTLLARFGSLVRPILYWWFARGAQPEPRPGFQTSSNASNSDSYR